jgi:hypothetical protein
MVVGGIFLFEASGPRLESQPATFSTIPFMTKNGLLRNDLLAAAAVVERALPLCVTGDPMSMAIVHRAYQWPLSNWHRLDEYIFATESSRV